MVCLKMGFYETSEKLSPRSHPTHNCKMAAGRSGIIIITYSRVIEELIKTR